MLIPGPKSKVKVKVTDWVFIKITISNYPHPPHPRESFKIAMYSYISKTIGMDRFTLNKFLPIPISTDFENFNLTDTDNEN